MKLLTYLNRQVHVKLSNGFFYVGDVVAATEEDIDLIDRTGKRVSISKGFILSIEEVKGNVY